MLGKYFRFRVLSDLDLTLTYNDGAVIEVTWIPWKFSSGDRSNGAEVKHNSDFLTTGETLAAAAETEGAVVDNSSDLYLGLNGTFRVVADLTSTDGTMYLYVEESTDNSIWPSDQADFDIEKHMTFVCALEMSTDAADEGAAKNFRL